MSKFLPAPEHRRFAVMGLTLVVAVVAAAFVGYGLLSSDDGVASSTGATTTTSSGNDQEQAMLAFTQCMRENGVPDFPDPIANADGTFSIQPPTGAMNQQATQEAMQTCRPNLEGVQMGSSMPGTSERQDALLAFAQCMRANGLPDFPDPIPDKGLFGMLKGYDTDSPSFQESMTACSDELSALGIGIQGGDS